eukprot:6203888-Pleurochrysis_carterae.AAC.3
MRKNCHMATSLDTAERQRAHCVISCRRHATALVFETAMHIIGIRSRCFSGSTRDNELVVGDAASFAAPQRQQLR